MSKSRQCSIWSRISPKVTEKLPPDLENGRAAVRYYQECLKLHQLRHSLKLLVIASPAVALRRPLRIQTS